MPQSEPRLAPTKLGIPVNMDKDETVEVIELMEELAKVTNFTKNHITRTMDTRIFNPYLIKISKDNKDK